MPDEFIIGFDGKCTNMPEEFIPRRGMELDEKLLFSEEHLQSATAISDYSRCARSMRKRLHESVACDMRS